MTVIVSILFFYFIGYPTAFLAATECTQAGYAIAGRTMLWPLFVLKALFRAISAGLEDLFA